MKKTILILDDEPNIRHDLLKNLKNKGYEVCAAETVEAANNIIEKHDVDFAIIDLKLDYNSEYGGVEAIEKLNNIQPRTKILILSAYEPNAEIEAKLNNVDVDGFISKGGERNYILAVIDELARLRSLPPKKKKCFVIMPFSATTSCNQDHWSEIFENTIKAAVDESGFNYECFRASCVIGNIIKDIIDHLNKSDVVIADMTDRNPNVFYELGVRHALKDATILITQNMNDIPFDLRHYAAIEYDWKTKKGRDNFKEEIKRVFLKIESDPARNNTMSPVRQYLNINLSD
jgi:response regulator RpfG family c-di-GMP phosphodiesterase